MTPKLRDRRRAGRAIDEGYRDAVRSRLTFIAAVVLAASALASCASEAASETTTGTALPPEAEQLVGRWAHFDVVAYEDTDMASSIISFGFNDFSIVDGELVDQASFCFSEQRTNQPITTSISDAATQAIKPPSTPVEVEEVDGVLTIRRPATPTPVGIRLADPVNDRLPTDPADPRIVDDDGDGNPGVTVKIKVTDDFGGELYIARREIFAYDAALVSPDRLEGTVDDHSEQLVIGASDPVFATSKAQWVQRADRSLSPIVLVRVDDSWDCERLAAERATLLPPTPDVDR
jgi:hypothetical protein